MREEVDPSLSKPLRSTHFRHAKTCVIVRMALASEPHDSTVNPDRGIHVEMESPPKKLGGGSWQR